MTVLFFDEHGDALRGGQRTLLTVAAEALAQGHRVVVASLTSGRLLEAASELGCEVEVWPRRGFVFGFDGDFRQASKAVRWRAGLSTVAEGLRLYRRVLRLRPDAVYLSALRASLFLWPLLFDRRRSLWYAQGNADLGLTSRAASLVPSDLVAVSTESRRAFGVVDLDRFTVTTVPVGVDTSTIIRRPPGHRDGNRVRVLCVGPVIPAKGQLRLARACVMLQNKLGGIVELTLIGGTGSNEHFSYIEQIRSECNSIEVVDRGWFEDLSGLYSEYDVLALTSEAEGTPRVFVEALAAGLPVVATAVGGVQEFVEPEPMAFLVPDDATDGAIAEALAEAYQAVTTTASAELADVSSRFDPEHMAAQVVAILLSDGPARSLGRRQRLLRHIKELAGRSDTGRVSEPAWAP